MLETITLFFDGSCEPINPHGVATYGWVVRGERELIASGAGLLASGNHPLATNQSAEYCALMMALDWLLSAELKPGCRLQIHGDSTLVIEQVSGRWQCRAPHLVPLLERVRDQLAELGVSWTATWIPRLENHAADALARHAYEQHTGRHFSIRA